MGSPKQPVGVADYCQFLISSQNNYTLTHYAEHVNTVNHDLVKLFLENERLIGSAVWQQVKESIKDSDEGYIVLDDTVIDKRYSRKIDPVCCQYRSVRPLDSDSAYQPVSEFAWVAHFYIQGQNAQLKKKLKEIPRKWFSISVSTNRIDVVAANVCHSMVR